MRREAGEVRGERGEKVRGGRGERGEKVRGIGVRGREGGEG